MLYETKAGENISWVIFHFFKSEIEPWSQNYMLTIHYPNLQPNQIPYPTLFELQIQEKILPYVRSLTNSF